MADEKQDVVRTRVREFLAARVAGRELADTDDIFEQGYANSLFVVQLIAFVERQFDLTLDQDDLEFDNFRTVDSLVGLVNAKNPRYDERTGKGAA